MMEEEDWCKGFSLSRILRDWELESLNNDLFQICKARAFCVFQIPFCFRLVFGTVGASSAVAYVLDSLHVFSGATLLESRGPSRMLLPRASAFTGTASFMPEPQLGLSNRSFPCYRPHLLPLARF